MMKHMRMWAATAVHHQRKEVTLQEIHDFHEGLIGTSSGTTTTPPIVEVPTDGEFAKAHSRSGAERLGR